MSYLPGFTFIDPVDPEPLMVVTLGTKDEGRGDGTGVNGEGDGDGTGGPSTI